MMCQADRQARVIIYAPGLLQEGPGRRECCLHESPPLEREHFFAIQPLPNEDVPFDAMGYESVLFKALVQDLLQQSDMRGGGLLGEGYVRKSNARPTQRSAGLLRGGADLE